jgi:hypothetical protein
MSRIRSSIKSIYGIHESAFVFITPSGTDSEMIPTWLAWQRQCPNFGTASEGRREKGEGRREKR